MGFPQALADLEGAVLSACARETEWPAQIAAGIYAGVGFAIAHPGLAETLAEDPGPETKPIQRYERVIGRMAGFLRARAPRSATLPAATDEAVVAGMIGLVGDHLRLGRVDRLQQILPELVLLTLLPYLGFEEAQLWANRIAD
ncbi:MAG TPA: hypothetical protein VFN92_09940 [Solirubrobacterales bacterium]|nr:hypothetical protein [Solirubrobacterales bacterium]